MARWSRVEPGRLLGRRARRGRSKSLQLMHCREGRNASSRNKRTILCHFSSPPCSRVCFSPSLAPCCCQTFPWSWRRSKRCRGRPTASLVLFGGGVLVVSGAGRDHERCGPDLRQFQCALGDRIRRARCAIPEIRPRLSRGARAQRAHPACGVAPASRRVHAVRRAAASLHGDLRIRRHRGRPLSGCGARTGCAISSDGCSPARGAPGRSAEDCSPMDFCSSWWRSRIDRSPLPP